MTSWYAIVSFRGQDSPRTCGNFLHRALFCVWEMHLRPQLLLLLATRCENIESIFLSRERGSHWNLWYVQTLVSWSRRRTQFEAATWSSRCFARTWVLKKHLKLNYKGAVRILCQSRGGGGGGGGEPKDDNCLRISLVRDLNRCKFSLVCYSSSFFPEGLLNNLIVVVWWCGRVW